MSTKYTGPIKEVEIVEKVKLTKEQAELIELYRNNTVIYGPIGYFAEEVKKYDNSVYRELAKLSVDDFAKAYYIGYEIEPEQPKFQPGDYVFVNWASGRDIHRVLKVDDNGEVILDQEYPRNKRPRMELVHPATTEEAYWFAKLGRKKVGDFKDGDVFVDRNGEVYVLGGAHELNDAKDWYADHDFKGIYPAESFRPFKEPE